MIMIYDNEPKIEDKEPSEPVEPEVILRDVKLDDYGGFDCLYLHDRFGWIPFTCPATPKGKDSKRAMWAYKDGRYEGEPEKKQGSHKLPPEEVDILRSRAYSNPITGSDKHFAEALRKRAMGDDEGAKEAESKGLSRVIEIKEQHPYE